MSRIEQARVDVGGEIAALDLDAIGALGFFRNVVATRYEGDIVAGSELRWSGADSDGSGNTISVSGGTPTGSWMCLGQLRNPIQANGSVTLYKRVS